VLTPDIPYILDIGGPDGRHWRKLMLHGAMDANFRFTFLAFTSFNTLADPACLH